MRSLAAVIIRKMVACAALVVAVLIVAAVNADDDDTAVRRVFCDRLSALVVRECPAAYPVCCIWPNSVFTACCPEHSMCDLYTGECVAMTNRSVISDDGEIIPGVHGTDEKGKGVEISLQFASSMVGVCFFGFLLLISSAVQYGKVIAFRRELRRQERELEARELLVAEGDEQHDDDHGPEADGDNEEEEDEAKLCKVCFCNKVDCALLNCGHIVCCRWCAKKLANCPICREPVDKLVRLPHVDGIRNAIGSSSAESRQAPLLVAPPVGGDVEPAGTAQIDDGDDHDGTVELTTHDDREALGVSAAPDTASVDVAAASKDD